MKLIVQNLVILTFTFIGTQAFSKTVRYELIIEKKEVNMSGKKTVDFALVVNGSIPAPALEFTEGDEAEITVKNRIPDDEVSIHWHGILLPPEMDGVPYVNTPPIRSGEDFTFKFKLRQHGTYWYHSHTNVQEQKGIYGAFIIHPKEKIFSYDKDVAVVISDWSDEDATDILKNLRKDGDYYLYKKNTMRSWWGAMQGHSLGTFLHNEWTRMGGMDFSDVGYDAFLLNGKRELQLAEAHPGEKVRIRLINAAASTYFFVSLGQTPMRVISADGLDIKPIKASEILIGMAETYDILFEVPEHKNYELLVTAQDGTGVTSGWIGMGEKVSSPRKPAPPMYEAMDHSSGGGHGSHGEMDHSMHQGHNMKSADGRHEDKALASGDSHEGHKIEETTKVAPIDHSKMDHSQHMGHDTSDEGKAKEKDHGGDTKVQDHNGHSMETSGTADHSAHGGHENHEDSKDQEAMHHHGTNMRAGEIRVVKTLTVDELESPEPTAFNNSTKVHDVKLELDGDMERYVWHINGKAIHEERNIEINENDVVRFTFVNKTMMHHPMHLHGHFFRVLNKHGESSPLKHTVDVPPHVTTVIEFLANEPGEWMLHCHNLYHLKTGMARVVKYSTFTPKPEIAKWQSYDPHRLDHLYFYGKLEAASNHGEANFRLSNTWDEYNLRIEASNPSGDNFNYNEKWETEGDLLYKRWFNRFFHILGGASYFDEETSGTIGVGYLLPMLVESSLFIDHRGGLRLDLEKRFQWARYIFSDVDITVRPKAESDDRFEYEASLMYSSNWHWAAGLMQTDDNIGAGIEVQF